MSSATTVVPKRRLLHWMLPVLLVAATASQATFAQATPESDPETARCIVIELFVSDGQPESEMARAAVLRVIDSVPGIRAVSRSVDDSEKDRSRLARIARHFKFENAATPVIYCCNRAIRSGKDALDFEQQLRKNLTIEVFTRVGCQRCVQAKLFMPELSRRYPALDIVYRDVTNDSVALADLNNLVSKHNKWATSTPVFHFCDQLLIGFDRPESTGARLKQSLDRWSEPCPAARQPSDSDSSNWQRKSAREVAAVGPFQDSSSR